MKILIFNWRDTKNPHAGGAEVFTREVSQRWAKEGHEVTLFCSAFPGCRSEEKAGGVRIVRRGNRFSVYFHAFRFYRRGVYDVVVDEINTIPFFTPLYVREGRVALIHQLAREFWLCEVPVLGALGYLLEPLYMRLYCAVKTVTVSESTRIDLLSWGFRDVSIVCEGIDFAPAGAPAQKESELTLLFVGRLKKAKKPEDAAKAFSIIRRDVPGARLWMAGDGYVKVPGKDGVTYLGRVSGKKKRELMSRAHILLVPAVREGWGLVVTEANACGTPAVAYDVGGLRDSVKHKRTGILCAKSPKAMAEAAVSLWRDKRRLREYSRNALDDAREYSWERSADEFLAVIEKGCRRR